MVNYDPAAWHHPNDQNHERWAGDNVEPSEIEQADRELAEAQRRSAANVGRDYALAPGPEEGKWGMKDSKWLLEKLIAVYWAGFRKGEELKGKDLGSDKFLSDRAEVITKAKDDITKRFKVSSK